MSDDFTTGSNSPPDTDVRLYDQQPRLRTNSSPGKDQDDLTNITVVTKSQSPHPRSPLPSFSPSPYITHRLTPLVELSYHFFPFNILTRRSQLQIPPLVNGNGVSNNVNNPMIAEETTSRTYLYCLLFLLLCSLIFAGEYLWIDHKYHANEDKRLAHAKQTLINTEQLLTSRQEELRRTLNTLHTHSKTIDTLNHELTSRDDALHVYRQLVTDLQAKTAANEAEEIERRNRAQAIMNSTSHLFKAHTAKVESVTRLIDVDDVNQPRNETEAVDAVEASIAHRLVDQDKNEYILSNPTDSSLKTVDSRLILDLGIVIITSAVGGICASLIHQPVLLGYLLGGSIIGPGGLRLIGQFVQVETLAEFGATFLLFALGVEFNIDKLSAVRGVSFAGGALQMLGILTVTAIIAVFYLRIEFSTSLFIGAVLSMSSTTVVVKSLMEKKELNTSVGQVMLGLLIVQDLFLSLLLSLLSLSHSSADTFVHDIFYLLAKFIVLAVIVVVCMFLWPQVLRLLDHSKSHDLFLLGLVALCVMLTVVSDKIIGSAEVGAFLSGILISSSPTATAQLTARSLRLFAPIRDMFGALFFSAMGMLINPHFLYDNVWNVLMLVAATLAMKTCVTYLIIRLFSYPSSSALHIALSLSQVGEFAFILASQGLHEGLLSREDYMTLLGVTAVSIFFTPAIIAMSENIRSWTTGIPHSSMRLEWKKEIERSDREEEDDLETDETDVKEIDKDEDDENESHETDLLFKSRQEEKHIPRHHQPAINSPTILPTMFNSLFTTAAAPSILPLPVRMSSNVNINNTSNGTSGTTNWKDRRRVRQMMKKRQLVEEEKKVNADNNNYSTTAPVDEKEGDGSINEIPNQNLQEEEKEELEDS